MIVDPSRAFLAFAVLGTALAVRDAVVDTRRAAFYASAVAYGLILERASMVWFGAYRYHVSEYFVVIAGVPVLVGFGWAAILYAGWRVGGSLPRGAQALFVGLYALHIDLAMDAVAIRLSYWTWAVDGLWFGVRIGNFFGWFCVAVLFVLFWGLLEDRWGTMAATLAPFPAMAGLVACLQAWTTFVRPVPTYRIAAMGGIAVVAAVAIARQDRGLRRVPGRVHAIPVLFHLYFLAWAVAIDAAVGIQGIGLSLLAASVAMALPDLGREWSRKALLN